MNKKAFAGLFLLIIVGGASFRLVDLGVRPMHHDEANQAVKFGVLLEKGEYRYDRADHHGPSLYYLSLPFARALGERTLAELDERTLRLVPAVFGLGTVVLLLLFVPLMGRERALWGALGLAVSPVMVYFSRFYIQETLLFFFLTGFSAAVWQYRKKPSYGWAIAAGFFAGMMYSTKETSVIAFGAIAAAFLLTRLTTGTEKRGYGAPRKQDRPERTRESGNPDAQKSQENSNQEPGPEKGSAYKPQIPGGRQRTALRWAHLALGVGTAAFIAVLFFTSFFQNPRGFIDSILSFKVYFAKAGDAGFHVYPWSYYLKMLSFSKTGSGPVWSEALILILAVAGIIAAFRLRPERPSSKLWRPNEGDRSFLIFVSFYAVISTAAFSLIPYKTPWNVLPFYFGFILLAGNGAMALLRAFKSRTGRAAVLVLLAAGFAHLGAQARRAALVYPADPRNPYVYAQTGPGFMKLVRKVEDLAAVHPDRDKMFIQVVAGPYETWPLPWYLRRFERVGYWTDAAGAPSPGPAAVLITDAEQAGRLESLINISYQSEYYELRPNVFLVLHVHNDLWEAYLKSRGQR